MSGSQTIEIFAHDEFDILQIGRVLAKNIKPGCLILLEGTLGAGKSSMVRAIIRQMLGQNELEVPSPTFLLVLPYENDRLSILHADLYRLEHEDEIEELGLFDDKDAIIFVEWPERAPWLKENADLIISLKFSPEHEGRILEINSPDNPQLLEGLSDLISDRPDL